MTLSEMHKWLYCNPEYKITMVLNKYFEVEAFHNDEIIYQAQYPHFDFTVFERAILSCIIHRNETKQ